MSEERSIPTSAPADRPSFKILVDGSQISGEYQVQGILINRSFNRIASAEILILDGDPASEDFKASNAAEFAPGREVEIQAGYHSVEESVFKGIIIRHGLQVHQNKPAVLVVECRDKAVALTVGRKSKYYYDSTDADIIETIASERGLDTDVEATDTTHAQMVQFYASDWDFVLARAEANGKLIATQDGTLTVRAPAPSGAPVITLTFGGNMMEFEAQMDARHQYSSVSSYAWNAADQEMLRLEGTDSGATTPGNISSGDLSNVISLDEYQLKHSGQLADDELQAWADGQMLKSGYSKSCGRVRVQGFSSLRLGDLFALAGVGERFNGNAMTTGLRHEINSKNWETHIMFGLSPEFFGSVQRDMNAAPANGLLPAINGLQIGLVTALEGDPDGEDRIQVRIPMIDPGEQGTWARIARLDGGDNRGSIFLPDIGDEVILGFLDDDPRNPIVLGMLNSSAKPSPIPASDDNHEKGFVTRSKMKLSFNDDLVCMILETPNGNRLLLSDDDGGLSLQDENDNRIILSSDGIVIESAADLKLVASGDIKLEGANIESAASAEFKAEGASGAEFSSGGNTVVKGTMVQIN